MDKANEFITRFTELEAVARDTYGIANDESVIYSLGNYFPSERGPLHAIGEVRNFLQHNCKIGCGPAAEPSDVAITYVLSLKNRILNRPTCHKVGIPLAQIFCRTLADHVLATIKEMKKQAFSCVPIMDGGKVVGAFSAESIMGFLGGGDIFDEKMTFADIKGCLRLEGRDSEVFLFAKPLEALDDVADRCATEGRKGNHVTAVFETASGKATDPLQFMLTPWDLIGKE